MKQKKDQFVIACLESPSTAETVLLYARHCAARLGKGIIVLNVSKEGENDWLKQYGLPYVGLKGDWKTAIDGLPTAFGGVLAVTSVNTDAPRSSIANPTTLLKTFADCKIAFLVVNSLRPEGSSASVGQQINGHWPLATTLTLDHRRESKEKLVWGSYMVRFFASRLTVVTPAYNDAGLREKVKNNVLFLKKIYTSLDVDYTLRQVELPRLTSPDMAVLKGMEDDGLLIAMTTDRRDRDIGDILMGNPERRLLAAATVPILFLNQRDDLYVLCD